MLLALTRPFRSFCDVFYHIREKVTSKYPENEQAKYVSVSGFIFLRFFCPAVLGPKLFSLWSNPMTRAQARTLTLIAKVLQNLANLVEFGYKEEYMRNMNPLILANLDRVKVFIDAVSIPKLGHVAQLKRSVLPWDIAPPGSGSSRKPDYARECFRLFQHFEMARAKVIDETDTENRPIYDRLALMLNTLRDRHVQAADIARSRSPYTPQSGRGPESPLAANAHRRVMSDNVAPTPAPATAPSRPVIRAVGPPPAAMSSIKRQTLQSSPTMQRPTSRDKTATTFSIIRGVAPVEPDTPIVGLPMKATLDGSIPVADFPEYQKQATLKRTPATAAAASSAAEPTIARKNLSKLEAMLADLDEAVNAANAIVGSIPDGSDSPALAPIAATPTISVQESSVDDLIAQAQSAGRANLTNLTALEIPDAVSNVEVRFTCTAPLLLLTLLPGHHSIRQQAS